MTQLVAIKISLVYSLLKGPAEINSLFVVMALYFKHVRKIAYNVTDRRVPVCASWIL